MTLAKFVKEETNKLKAENENINKRIASAPNNKIVEMEAKINDIWKKIAALSPKANGPKKGNDAANDAYASTHLVSTHAEDYNKKLSDLESRINNLQRMPASLNDENLMNRLAKLEQKLENKSSQQVGAGQKCFHCTV